MHSTHVPLLSSLVLGSFLAQSTPKTEWKEDALALPKPRLR